MNIKKLEGINFVPFNDKDKQFDCAVREITFSLDNVMAHYADFLQEGDYEYGRLRQFEPPSMHESITYQRQICRLTWLRSKCFQYSSDESVQLWRRHRQEFELLRMMLDEKHLLGLSKTKSKRNLCE